MKRQKHPARNPSPFTLHPSKPRPRSRAVRPAINYGPLEERRVPNAYPIANPDPFYYTAAGTQLVVNAGSGVLANDFDAEGDTMTASVVTNPSSGTLNSFNSDGSFSYTPNGGFRGIDFFTYKVNDGTVDGTTVRANIVVGTGFSARQNADQRVGANSLHTGGLTRYQPLSAGLGLTI